MLLSDVSCASLIIRDLSILGFTRWGVFCSYKSFFIAVHGPIRTLQAYEHVSSEQIRKNAVSPDLMAVL